MFIFFSSYLLNEENFIVQWLADVFSSYDDLLTVKEKVITRAYSSPLEVVNAVKTLMQACRNAVDNKRSPVRIFIWPYFFSFS